ncbi:hypothetical protein Gpo141_00009154 [Globisporangium polare]
MLDHHTMSHHQPQPHHTIHMTDSETISISIGVGADARTASSIVLPRGHDLVKHLERLIPAMTKTVEAAAYQQHQYQQQPQHYTNVARGYDVRRQHVRAHHPYQQQQPQRQQQYFHQQELPHSPYHSDASSSGSTTAPSSVSSGSLQDNHMMMEQYAGVRRRRGPTGGQGAGKKCQFPNCEKISVSRGLCRGHGGGRRCQHEGCSKGAQSRSDFCWAHGGGQRCEVKNCMRSRKSKRFCVAHLSWEGVVSLTDGANHQDTGATASYRAYEQPKAIMPKLLAPAYLPEPAAPLSPPSSAAAIKFPPLSMSAKLPSLQQALRKNLCVSNSASVSSSATQRSAGFSHQQTAA